MIEKQNLVDKFTVNLPLLFHADKKSLKLEIKPYLQPFEKELALLELKALLGNKVKILEQDGLYVINSDDADELFLRRRLTYWQRLGRTNLAPTLQTLIELTQNGRRELIHKDKLHNARRLRYGPHDLHEYRGKFFPQLVKSLINISTITSKSIVLDPMCGSGTTTCEAICSGLSSIGADLNPLSALISSVKSNVPLQGLSEFEKSTKKYMSKFTFPTINEDRIWSEHDIEYLYRWFDKRALKDLASILYEIKKIRSKFYKEFFQVCLSNIIRNVSWQKETDLRVRKEIKPYIKGAVIKSFLEVVDEQIDRISAYLTVLPLNNKKITADLRNGDARDVGKLFSDFRGKVDLIITSPPYATALPYLDTDRLSLITLGLLPKNKHKSIEAFMIGTREVSEKERSEFWDLYQNRKAVLPEIIVNLIDSIAEKNHKQGIGFRRRNLPALLGKYFLDMFDAMTSARLLMRKGANAFYVVGNNSTMLDNEKLLIPTDEFLYELGKYAGWTPHKMIPMELLSSRDIFKDNRGSSETILWFKA